jgi:hypothetical protein
MRERREVVLILWRESGRSTVLRRVSDFVELTLLCEKSIGNQVSSFSKVWPKGSSETVRLTCESIRSLFFPLVFAHSSVLIVVDLIRSLVTL